MNYVVSYCVAGLEVLIDGLCSQSVLIEESGQVSPLDLGLPCEPLRPSPTRARTDDKTPFRTRQRHVQQTTRLIELMPCRLPGYYFILCLEHVDDVRCESFAPCIVVKVTLPGNRAGMTSLSDPIDSISEAR